jgi:hypothetical protein
MAGEQKGGGYYPEGHYGTFQGPPPFVQQPQTADPERGSYYPPIAGSLPPIFFFPSLKNPILSFDAVFSS